MEYIHGHPSSAADDDTTVVGVNIKQERPEEYVTDQSTSKTKIHDRVENTDTPAEVMVVKQEVDDRTTDAHVIPVTSLAPEEGTGSPTQTVCKTEVAPVSLFFDMFRRICFC